MRTILLVGLAVAAMSAQAPPVPAPATEAEQLRMQLNEALDELAIARAQRGDCEATLAPIEASQRRADSQRRWAEAKAALERARPGFECEARTNTCTPKPPAPEPKKNGGGPPS